MISSSNGQPPIYVFVNTIKSSVDEMLELLNEMQAKPTVIEYLCGVKLTGCIRVEEASALNKPEVKQAMMLGKFTISDAASQAIVKRAMSHYEKPLNMLEVCAGKGTKTLIFQSVCNEM